MQESPACDTNSLIMFYIVAKPDNLFCCGSSSFDHFIIKINNMDTKMQTKLTQRNDNFNIVSSVFCCSSAALHPTVMCPTCYFV